MEPARDNNIVDYHDRPRHCLDTVMLKDLYEFRRANNPALQHKSCADIAADAGMSESTLRNLLTGRCRNPNGETLTGLLDAIGGGSLDRLYGYRGDDNDGDTASYTAMIHELTERIEQQQQRLDYKMGRIQEQDVEIGKLNERLAAKDKTIKNLEGMNAKREATVDGLRRDLKRQRVAMAIIIFLMLVAEIIMVF